PVPMPMASTKATTNEAPKRRASDRRRRGRAADTPPATSAASSGSPARVSPSGVEVLAAGTAAVLGTSVIRYSCAVGLRRASSPAAAPSSRVNANLSRRLGRRDYDAGHPSDVTPRLAQRRLGPGAGQGS